jgi:azurin
MNARNLLIPALVAAAALSGCSKSDSTAAPSASAAASGPREIDIEAGDTMKYSVTEITAKPGEDLKVVLTNTGTQPKEVMGHNFVLLQAGVDAAAYDAAAAQAKDTGYFPANLANQVITHIDLLGPRKSGEADFKAPTTPGTYTYLCTFPAHFQVGMKGTLTVK